MYVTKKALPRRAFLRGMGSTMVALPFLDAMVPAFATAATMKSPTRLGFMYAPNGANQAKFMPVGEGTAWEFSPTLRPLEPHRDQLFIPSYLANRASEGQGEGGGDHARACSGWLNGSHSLSPREEGANRPRSGTSADQMAAREFSKYTRLASLETSLEGPSESGVCGLGPCEYHFTISWRTPTTPLPGEPNPRVVFQRLFGEGGTAEEQLSRLGRERSILDSVTEEMNRLNRQLGASDRAMVSDYLEAVRDSERRIQRTEEQSASLEMPLPNRPLGISDDFDERARIMIDLIVLAYRADITRVMTNVIGREQGSRSYAWIGVPENHHSISHHDNDPVKFEKQQKVDEYHVKQFAYLLQSMKDTPDGDGNLLDHTLLLYGTGLGDSNVHAHHDLNIVLAGGGNGAFKPGGRHVAYPRNTPLSNLLVSMLLMAGLPVEKVGDSTGPLDHV